MSAPMCLKPKVAKDAAKRAVEVMNKEGQLKGLNIKKSGENYNNAIEAIARKASIFWRKNDEDENCFDDINSFVRYLEEGAQVAIPDSNYEVYMKVYNKLIKDTFIDDNDNEVPQPRIFYWEDPEEMKAVYIEEIEEVLEKLPENKTKGITAEGVFNDMILIEEEAADDNDEGPIKLVLTVKEPKKGGILTRQEAVLQRLIQLTEKVENTGYGKWKLDGKLIKTKNVTTITSSGDTVFPTIAGHIGTQVDKVARLFFDKSSILWEENKNGEYKLRDENSLRTLIETHLRNMFTYKGLLNLLNDFVKVEEKIKKSFGEDAIVFSTDYKMVALHENDKDSREWVIGSPDLLVIDSEGKVHVIDVKTNKINISKGSDYTNPYKGKEDTEKRYRNQIYYYIGILRSWGFNVDSTPYILMADTFYESSDLTDFDKKLLRVKEGKPIGRKVTGEGNKDIFKLTRGESWDESNVEIKESGQTLGAYAEQNPADILMTLGEKGNKEADRAVKLLYIEPRLHVEDPTAETREVAGLIELENLDETEDEEIREQVSFLDQYESLTQEEKEIYNRFAGKPMRNRPLVGITKLADTDIFSNPNLIGSKEVEFLASRVMIEVNLWITKMQRGETIKAPNIGLIKNDKASSYNIPINNPEKTKGRSREKIIQYIGIDRLINAAFENVIGRRYAYGNIDNLTYEKANIKDDDPEKDEKLEKEKELRKRRNDKIEFLRSHLTQFKIQGLRTLLSLENTVVPVIKRKSRTLNNDSEDIAAPDNSKLLIDVGNDEDLASYTEKILEGLTDPEAWTVENRRQSNKLSLAQEVRLAFTYLLETDTEGNIKRDPYGWGIDLLRDQTASIQAVLDNCKNCETEEEFDAALKQMAVVPENRWVSQIIKRLEGDKNTKKKFIRNFRKDFTTYSICKVKVVGGVRTVVVEVVNLKSAFDVMITKLQNAFADGKVGSWKIDGAYYSLVSGSDSYNKINELVLKDISKEIGNIKKDLAKIYTRITNEVEDGKDKDKSTKEKNSIIATKVREELQKKDPRYNKSIIDRVTSVLHGIGIFVPTKAVAAKCLAKVSNPRFNSTSSTLAQVDNILSQLKTQVKKQKGLPFGLGGLEAYNSYKPLVNNLSDYVQETVESSVYEGGKTYYSYTNPSKLQYTIRNMSDAINSLEEDSPEGKIKFKQYIEDNFGRYSGWYKDSEGKEWLNDLLKNITSNSKEGKAARQALAHKVELTYIGQPYKTLGSLAFQLSLLHNYFGTQDDPKDTRWFGMPTMSNKPANEFIRMLKYKSAYTDKGINDDIVEKVLMPTYQQEMNRIADVLYHYTHGSVATDQIDITDKKLEKAGWSEEEIEALQDHINSRTVTVDEVKKLVKLNSGAKFHFLWYLNNEIANDETKKEKGGIAERITNSINNLLTPKSKRKVDSISESVEKATLNKVREAIESNMIKIVEEEIHRMEDIGLFDEKTIKQNGKEVQVMVYQEEFGDKLGKGKKKMYEGIRDYIWQDIAANINIIQITGGDLAYFGSAENYQKRIAQEHAPGLPLVHDDDVDDGYIRSVYVTDEILKKSELIHNAIVYLNKIRKNWPKENEDRLDIIIQDIQESLEDINVTDGQSLSGLTSIRKKLSMQGGWTDAHEEAFKRISAGNFDLHDLEILIQPSKPFVTADVPKISDSPTMPLRRVSIQAKNSEYMILLADALNRAAGKRSKMSAIYDFMERTAKEHDKQGIDTVHFLNVGKVGVTGVIRLDKFDEEFNKLVEEGIDYEGELEPLVKYYLKGKRRAITENDYNPLLTEFMLSHVRRYNESGTPSAQSKADFDRENAFVDEKKLKYAEIVYNSNYVDTVHYSRYIIQQEVPAHFGDNDQLYGSQIRILGISDISPNAKFNVRGEKEPMGAQTLIDEFKRLHAKNIEQAYQQLLKDIGLDKIMVDGKIQDIDSVLANEELDDEEKEKYLTKRDYVFQNLEYLLNKELARDLHYSLDLRRACTLSYRTDGHVDNFLIPLFEPIQSTRIQMLINSIIKRTINKQKINGGPIVQVSGFDSDLHVRFQSKKDGKPLQTLEEFRREKLSKYSKEELKKNGKSIEAQILKAFLKGLEDNQAGIAYFECYITCPNKTLEALITKEDGSLMTPKEIEKRMPKVWEEMSKIIGYRIPTEAKYSMLPLKIMGFLPSKSGQGIIMPKEITALTGSDFDIDKMYIMMKEFMEVTLESIMINGDNSIEDAVVRMLNLEKKLKRKLTEKEDAVVNNLVGIAMRIVSGDINLSLYDALKGVDLNEKERKLMIKNIIDPFRDMVLERTFVNIDAKDEKFSSYMKAHPDPETEKRARDNRIIDLQWAVLTSEDTAPKILHPQSFKEVGRVGLFHEILQNKLKDEKNKEWTWESLEDYYNDLVEKYGISGAISKLENMLENKAVYNTTLPSAKIYFQRQNMQGSQLVAICANANVSHAFVSGYNVYLDLESNGKNSSFSLFGHTIGDNDPMSLTRIDPVRGFDGTLVSDTLGMLLASAVDTARKPWLKKSNMDTFTIGVAITLARIGYSYEDIALFIDQPILRELSDTYFKNKIENYYDGKMAIKQMAKDLEIEDIDDLTIVKETGEKELLTLDNLKEMVDLSISDYKNDEDYKADQEEVLKVFNVLFKVAGSMQKLTFTTKFNSVSNAVGPLISNTLEELNKVNDFIDNAESEYFYITSSDEEVDAEGNKIDDAQSILFKDPILNAFFSSTVGEGGASENLFSMFFPQYFPGFKEVLQHFKDNYIKYGNVNSKLADSLLNDYIYFLLTYSDQDRGIRPVIPYTKDDLDLLVKEIIDNMEYMQDLSKKMAYKNLILDNTVGNNGLYIRMADNFIKIDTLLFSSGQLDVENQDDIKWAWNDLLLVDDPNLDKNENAAVKRFAMDLFYYMLIRNGFGFSPRTMMHLASTMVKLNAQFSTDVQVAADKDKYAPYIDGIRNLKYLDKVVAIDNPTMIDRFCKQYVRNHSNNKAFAPTLSNENPIINTEAIEGEAVFTVDAQDEFKLAPIKKGDDFCEFVSIIFTDRRTGTSERRLFKLRYSEETDTDDIRVVYTEIPSLGILNQFLEYNANDDMEEKSYYTPYRGDDEELTEEKEGKEDSSEDEEERMYQSSGSTKKQKARIAIKNALEEIGEIDDANNASLKKILTNMLVDSYSSNSNPLSRAFKTLLNPKVGKEERLNSYETIKEATVKEMNEIQKDAGMCSGLK